MEPTSVDQTEQDIVEPSPIGEVILGSVDPRTLTREQFHACPDLLYHGSYGPFTFDQGYNYNDPKNEKFSSTLGAGFYLTADKARGDDHASFRQHPESEAPTVYEFLPYQAKVYDSRDKNDPTRNAPMPKELIIEWREFYKNTPHVYPDGYKSDEDREWINTHRTEVDQEERHQRKERLDAKSDDIEFQAHLNQLLFTNHANATLLALIGPTNSAEYAAKPFSQFMKSKGFDGAIAIEVADGTAQKYGKGIRDASYVFYDTSKIGTYETWHPEENK